LQDLALVLQDFALAVQDLAVVLQDRRVLLQDLAVVLQDLAVLLQDRRILLPDLAALLPDRRVLLQDLAVLLQDLAVHGRGVRTRRAFLLYGRQPYSRICGNRGWEEPDDGQKQQRSRRTGRATRHSRGEAVAHRRGDL
jgi:hypothetical protein